MRFRRSCHRPPLVLFSKHYSLVEASKMDVAKGKAVPQVEIWPYRRADFTAVGLDECCFSSTPASSLHLPTDLVTTRCRDASVQLTPRRVVSNQPGQRAGPVPQAREGMQPPLCRATNCAASPAFVQVGSWREPLPGILMWSLPVFAHSIKVYVRQELKVERRVISFNCFGAPVFSRGAFVSHLPVLQAFHYQK